MRIAFFLATLSDSLFHGEFLHGIGTHMCIHTHIHKSCIDKYHNDNPSITNALILQDWNDWITEIMFIFNFKFPRVSG